MSPILLATHINPVTSYIVLPSSQHKTFGTIFTPIRLLSLNLTPISFVLKIAMWCLIVVSLDITFSWPRVIRRVVGDYIFFNLSVGYFLNIEKSYLFLRIPVFLGRRLYLFRNIILHGKYWPSWLFVSIWWKICPFVFPLQQKWSYYFWSHHSHHRHSRQHRMTPR